MATASEQVEIRPCRTALISAMQLALAMAQPADAQFPAEINLSDLDGTNGFVLNGEAVRDYSGISVSAASDINADGIDDLFIGASGADSNGVNFSGRSYVVFGSRNGFPNPFSIGDLDWSNGIIINGAAGDNSGRSISVAGDVNDDGIDDLMIGAYLADINGKTAMGRAYILFGSNNSFAHPLNLSNINGLNGLVIDGEAQGDGLSRSISAAGDINHDGIDDLIIGADGADPNGNNLSGRSYVVFGSDSELPSPFSLTDLNGLNGFVLNGEAERDYSGVSVSTAGDFNGDGIDDLIIGADSADPNGNDNAGISYIVFGSASRLPNPFNLSSLNGLALNGEAVDDNSGVSVSTAGDINGDGIDDVIIGAYHADPNRMNRAGRSYVVFGSDSGFSHPLNLDTLNGLNGFALNGEVVQDYSGVSVSAAGDVNGDGVDDLIIGANGADPNGIDRAGRSYVVFGRAAYDLAIAKANGAGFVEPDTSTTWFIEVSNASMADVLGATLTDTLPPEVDAGTASWVCMAMGGATCPSGSGSGNINETVDLPAGSMLSYELTATVLANDGETVINTATISLPIGLTDIDPSNNSSTDSDPVGLFADGFEDEI